MLKIVVFDEFLFFTKKNFILEIYKKFFFGLCFTMRFYHRVLFSGPMELRKYWIRQFMITCRNCFTLISIGIWIGGKITSIRTMTVLTRTPYTQNIPIFRSKSKWKKIFRNITKNMWKFPRRNKIFWPFTSQDFWANFAYFFPKFRRNMAKNGEIWPDSSSQKIHGLMSYAYLIVRIFVQKLKMGKKLFFPIFLWKKRDFFKYPKKKQFFWLNEKIFIFFLQVHLYPWFNPHFRHPVVVKSRLVRMLIILTDPHFLLKMINFTKIQSATGLNPL